MERVLICLALALAIHGVHAQTSLDSLYAVWQDQARTDSSRAAAFKDYIWDGFLSSNPDTASMMADELIAFGNSRDFARARAWGYRLKGISHYYRNNYTQAFENYTLSLEISEQQGNLPEVSRILNDIGTIYFLQGDFQDALDCFTRGLRIAEQSGNQSTIAVFLSSIGSIYREQGAYPKALDYYIRSQKISEELDNQWGVSSSLLNIGIIYDMQEDYANARDYYVRSQEIFGQLGDQKGIAKSLLNTGGTYYEQKDYPKALEYFSQSLMIADQVGDPHLYANALGNIGIVYEEEGDFSNAMDYYSQSLHLNEQLGDQKGVAHQLNNLGALFQKQGEYARALEYCQSSNELASTIGVLDEQKVACRCLYRNYKALGNSAKALFYLEKMQEVEDSLQTEETTKKLQQMEFLKVMLQDSIEKAEEARLVQEAHQAEVRKQNRTRNILAGGGLLALLLAGGFFSRWRYVKKSKAIIEKEKNRSENLLLNILPEKIAQELKEKGKADARDFDMVSILFTDFKSFTEQSAKLSATELVSEINHCFRAFDEIIEQYKVEKIKTIGDAYMAAGGLPVPYEDSVKNTVLAALEMQAFVARRKAENDAANKPAFQMRVGIHTGPVVAGIVGIKKFQYDIWGDTVNTANRMESSGEAGKVNISQDTYKLIKGDPRFSFEPRGKVDVKGKGEMEMYFVYWRGNLAQNPTDLNEQDSLISESGSR